MNATSEIGSLVTLLKKKYIPFLQCIRKKRNALIGIEKHC